MISFSSALGMQAEMARCPEDGGGFVLLRQIQTTNCTFEFMCSGWPEHTRAAHPRLKNTAVVICGRYELLRDTPAALQAEVYM